MRREVVVVVAAGLALTLASCQRERPDLRGDELAGCPGGAPFTKVKITLSRDGAGSCQITRVKPEKICVLQGGVIRWKVKKDCEPAEGPEEAALEITGVEWLTKSCNPIFPRLEMGEPPANKLFCDVPDETEEGDYKYGLEGRGLRPIDPRIVVRGPGGP